MATNARRNADSNLLHPESSSLLRPRVDGAHGGGGVSFKLGSVIDVYELAQSSAGDLERILQTYRIPDHERQGLVLKLQFAFEQLEEQLLRHEDRDKHIDKLELQIRELERFRITKKDMDESLQKELHETETEWQNYTNTLLEQVQRLAEENAKLVKQRAQAAFEPATSAVTVIESKSGIDNRTQAEALADTITHLQEMMKLRESEVRDALSSADDKAATIQELNETLKRVKRARKDALRQSKRLFEHNLALQKNVRDVELHNVGLKHQMVELVQCNDELGRQVLAAGTPLAEVKEFQPKSLEHELFGGSGGDDNDDERPRFTLRELKQLLDEKTTLKQQVLDMKDELDYCLLKQKKVVKLASTASQAVEGYEDDDSLPVEGPLPEEPAEKMLEYFENRHRMERKGSTVRRLFKSVFGDLAKSPSIATLLGTAIMSSTVPQASTSSSSTTSSQHGSCSNSGD